MYREQIYVETATSLLAVPIFLTSFSKVFFTRQFREGKKIVEGWCKANKQI